MQNLNTNHSLPNKFVKDITSGEWLGDEHMYHFAQLVKPPRYNYALQEAWKRYLPDTIVSVSPTVKDIQILQSGGYKQNDKNSCLLSGLEKKGDEHWVCTYFDTTSIYVYDSLNKKVLCEEHKIYLKRLFPFYDFKKNPVQFPPVHHQPNSSDCGVFAIAFAVSLMNGQKPDELIYDVSLMRRHLLQIFESKEIQNFPCITRMQVSARDLNTAGQNHQMPLNSIQQSSQQSQVKTWAEIVQQPKRVVNSQVGALGNVQTFDEQPFHSKTARIDIEISDNRGPTNRVNRKNYEKTQNAKAKLTESGKRFDDSHVCSKLTSEVPRTADITDVPELGSQDSRLSKLVAESLPSKRADNVTENVVTTLSAKELRRQKRRNAPPVLSEKSKHEIMSGGWLTDLHMSHLAYLLTTHTEYSPRETWRIQRVVPVMPTVKHIQILHSNENHWVCAFFDTKSIFIYDSFNSKRLYENHEMFLRKLFPFYQFDSKPIKFPTVQRQTNVTDCGVFAIAFAISLAKGHRPDKITYDIPLMRAHLLKLFENNIVEEFPRVRTMRCALTNKNILSLKRVASDKGIEHPISQQSNIKVPRHAAVEQRDIDSAHTIHDEIKLLKSGKNVTDLQSRLSCRILDNVDVIKTKNNQEYSEKEQILTININQESTHYFSPNTDNCEQSGQGILEDTAKVDKCISDLYDKKSDQHFAEIKQLQNRNYYLKNAETLRDRARERYHSNDGKQRARARDRYHSNVETRRARMLERYYSNAESQKTKRRESYNLDSRKQLNRVHKYYTLNDETLKAAKRSNYLLNRDKICDQRRKQYNRQKKDSTMKQLKKNKAKKVIAKYQRIRNTNTIALIRSREKYIAKISSIIIDEKNEVDKRMKAESIIKWCIRERDLKISALRKNLTSIKNKAEVYLTKAAKCSNNKIQEKLSVLCGTSKHIASGESYFVESAYKHVPFHDPIIINSTGQAANILPLLRNPNKSGKSKRKSWPCDRMCKIKDITLLEKYVDFLRMLSTCTLKNVHKFIGKLECTAKYANGKLGHSQICYMGNASCKSIFLPAQILSAHFPSVRHMQRQVYKLINGCSKISVIDKALNDGDLAKLQDISKTAQQNAQRFENNTDHDIELNEEEIRKKYKMAFAALTKRSTDIPRLVCLSCEKLCFKREVTKVDKFRNPITTKIWTDLMEHVEAEGNAVEYVCNYCLPKLRQNTMPPRCILNQLITESVSETIQSLNDYERILVQRAKAFQTVQKCQTVAKKNLPHREMVQKVKGRTFHLPLPMEETLQKICPPTDPINLDHELYILVRGIPTKAKLVWEQLVDINKVWEALIWLKMNNPHYSEIKLPDSVEDLLANIKDIEFPVEDEASENEDGNLQELECLDKMETVNVESKKNEVVDSEQSGSLDQTKANTRAALLTQVSQSDEMYEQFTIHPMYEKRPNQTVTDLYQMLKINDVPLDNRYKSLDLLCFPHLYPYGRNGQHEDRSTRLTHAEFIKARLMSKHSQYRLDQQYLFYLLNDANIRQLSSGIYYKLNITNPSERFTAASYLEKLSREELEGNLNAIFSRLRNTEQYWSRPRNDVSCMIHHYGPATWFLTLSPSEWLWSDMIEYLREVGGPAAAKMSPSQLIAADPVSASRFIDNKFHAMLDFICSPDNPIGEVIHYFWRREYQGRGMQHFHLLVWIKDAPVIGKSSDEEIARFILKYVTCRMPPKHVSPDLYRKVNTHQRHKHNSYCLRSKQNKDGGSSRVCRFGFSRPITDHIVMRDVAVSIAGRRNLRGKRLYDLPRNANEVDINDYNAAVLNAWEGNMDMQFIGELTAVLMWYITKYMSKCEKSNTDKDIAAQINSTKSLCSRLWSFAQRMLNHRECGALEAADTLLGIPLHGTDPQTTIKWIDVNIIRNRKVKSRQEIGALDADSTDIFCDSVVDTHYPARPKELESTNLYDFVKWYEVTKVEPKAKDIEYYKMGKSLFLKKRKRGCLINHYKNNVDNQPERYYFALLLLFQPWRDTEELRNGCDTYTEAFESVQLELEEALEYHERITEIQKGIEHMKQLIEKRMAEAAQSQQSDTSDAVPLGCVPIEAEGAMKEFQARVQKLDTVNKSQKVSDLNLDQKRVFDVTMGAVSSNDARILRHYVSGEGGTGKSHLIEALVWSIKQNTGKDTAVTAPTGIAAFNVNGLTIHRLFQLPVEHGGTPKYKQLSDAALKVIREQLRNVALIIIDEVSMISNVTLMYIHLRLSEIFDTTDCKDGWFGKKHILLFGDLLQLPPVREEPAFTKLSSTVSNKLLGSMGSVDLWRELFTYDELTINMRQKNDQSYREILSRIRVGVVTDSDTEILASRKIRFTNYPTSSFSERVRELCDNINNLPNDTVCLLPTCRMCEILNEAMLTEIQSEEIQLMAHDTVDCPPSIRKKVHKILDTEDEDSSRTAGLAKLITVKIGAKVMIRRNIDVTLGLVNGTIGKITSVSRAIDTSDVEAVRIVLATGVEHVIERVDVKFEAMEGAFVIRKQFPICLSYGITIHKSQGLSLKNAVIDAGNSIFASGQVYVALSRVTSLEGLHLINYDPHSVLADNFAILEYNRLRKQYRPDLMEMAVPGIRPRKVKDRQWSVSKNVETCQEPVEQNTHNGTWRVKGFQNPDGVSCYANATIQCLFHCMPIRKCLLNQPNDDVLKILIENYMNSPSPGNVFHARKHAGKEFTLNKQQDVPEFLTSLLWKYEDLKNVVKHKVASIRRCADCGSKNETTEDGYILLLALPPQGKKTQTLTEIVEHNFSTLQKRVQNSSCQNCGSKNILRNSNISSASSCLIVQLMLHSVQNGEIEKITNFKIKAVPTDRLLICSKRYKVSSVIFHHEEQDSNKGHYTCMLRDGTSTWQHVDDYRVEKRSWITNAKDAYIFFLQLT